MGLTSAAPAFTVPTFWLTLHGFDVQAHVHKLQQRRLLIFCVKVPETLL